MIGVISKSGQTAVVKEFFQLFKTPWEFFREGRTYDVVLATSSDFNEVNARLLLIYGADIKSCDKQKKISVSSRLPHACLNYQGMRVPIYGETLVFKETEESQICVMADSAIAGLKICSGEKIVMRIGYDLFYEAELLLTKGQPIEWASIPTLDIHIQMLRNWILEAQIDMVEIPPFPAGYSFVVCLTHDVDFVGIRNHKFDHTMWGFLYRSTFGALANYVRGRSSLTRLLKSWQAAISLPLVHLGWIKDYWLQFDTYLQMEKNLPATYFLIPFKNRAGDKLSCKYSKKRSVAYDITEIPALMAILIGEGCEIGVHGIDAWHSAEKGREELKRIASLTKESLIGIRMHWLLNDENTFRILDEAGYAYDSSSGYNESIGYRNGTTQAFCPLGARKLLELPLNIQDGALFFAQRLNLTEKEAWIRCKGFLNKSVQFGGILTIVWHDRSPGPERFWGDFYAGLVRELRSQDAWFGTGRQVANWFMNRRKVFFESVDIYARNPGTKLCYRGDKIEPPLVLRVHRPSLSSVDRLVTGIDNMAIVDIPWAGEEMIELSHLFKDNLVPGF